MPLVRCTHCSGRARSRPCWLAARGRRPWVFLTRIRAEWCYMLSHVASASITGVRIASPTCIPSISLPPTSATLMGSSYCHLHGQQSLGTWAAAYEPLGGSDSLWPCGLCGRNLLSGGRNLSTPMANTAWLPSFRFGQLGGNYPDPICWVVVVQECAATTSYASMTAVLTERSSGEFISTHCVVNFGGEMQTTNDVLMQRGDGALSVFTHRM